MNARLRKLVARWGRPVATWLVIGLIVFLGRASLADHYRVPSGSMLPTVAVGDRVFVNKLAYGLRVPLTHSYLVERAGPRVGDVVVLDAPDEDKVLLKRVVATPGDEVRVLGGQIWLNGVAQPIEEVSGHLIEQLGDHPHEISLEHGGGPDYGPLTMPAREYLVMGDNRGDSRDGRFFGLVGRGSILGRVETIFVHEGHFSWRTP